MTRAAFAVPGALETPTGGYAYARRLLREAPGQGLDLGHVALPGSFPVPTPTHLGETEQILADLPAGQPLLIDGLAFGALPEALVGQITAPIVALCHHPLALEAGLSIDMARHLRRTETAALAMAARVITTSHATAGILSTDYGVAAERITVAPPGTDPAPRGPGSGKGRCQILAVGSLTRRKGHDRLIAALADLGALDWSLRIVGPESDPSVAAALRAQIKDAGLEDRIELAGALSLPALTAAYQSADLFVLASEYEGFGMAFAEAMSHGLPVLGLRSEAVEEATADAAQLVRADALPDALGALIRSPDQRTALADRCWTAAQTLLRWPQTAGIIARVLRDAIEAHTA
ncbi:MAG: glycosyltransferase family 4 protein [Pseudomonadota bacterium]